jgi:hypothetical protein
MHKLSSFLAGSVVHFMIHTGAGTAILLILLGAHASPSAAPQSYETPTEEIVVNQATGRVVIAVVKDAILIATTENPIEVETRPPTPVIIGSERIGIILGAVQWFSPSSQVELARLDLELPHLRAQVVGVSPHLGQAKAGDEATDIEVIGQGLLERLNKVAQGLHNKVDVPADEPVAELIVADYLTGYGPEVWQATYPMVQEEQKGDYWDTRVLRPRYLQFWPPEKGQPRTLVEFDYPPENAPPSLLALLRQRDPRLERISASDEKMALVATRLSDGESNKILAVDATQFLRAALGAVTPPNVRQTMAIIRPESGMQWILAPPPEPKRLGLQSDRPPDAPTLAKPHPSP